jgi:hypothetical protein
LYALNLAVARGENSIFELPVIYLESLRINDWHLKLSAFRAHTDSSAGSPFIVHRYRFFRAMQRSRRARHTAPAAAAAAAADEHLLGSPISAEFATAVEAAPIIPAAVVSPTDDKVATAAVVMSLAGLSCDGDFSATVAAIRVHESAARLHSFADECQQKEGVIRTPLVLLQILALVRQYECSSQLTASGASASHDVFGRGLEAHGQTSPTQCKGQCMRACAHSLSRCRVSVLVWSYFNDDLKHRWRSRLAWRLYQTQQRAPFDDMQQVRATGGA